MWLKKWRWRIRRQEAGQRCPLSLLYLLWIRARKWSVKAREVKRVELEVRKKVKA
jgi:hypothetical protein